jgi:hypothetical protein
MRGIQEKSFGRRCLETLIEVATPILAFLSPGCVESYTVTPRIGLNVPVEQTNPNIEFDSAVKYGVGGGFKTRDGTEWELGIDFFQTRGDTVASKTTSDVSTVTLGAKIPLFEKGRKTLFVTPQLCSYAETARTELIALPGMGYTENCGSLGYGFAIGTRFNGKSNGDGKGTSFNVEARYRRFSNLNNMYRGSDLEVDVGATFVF